MLLSPGTAHKMAELLWRSSLLIHQGLVPSQLQAALVEVAQDINSTPAV